MSFVVGVMFVLTPVAWASWLSAPAVPGNPWTLTWRYELSITGPDWSGQGRGSAKVAFTASYRGGRTKGEGQVTAQGSTTARGRTVPWSITGDLVVDGSVTAGLLTFTPRGTNYIATAGTQIPLDFFAGGPVSIPLRDGAERVEPSTLSAGGITYTTKAVWRLEGKESWRAVFDWTGLMLPGKALPLPTPGKVALKVQRRAVFDFDVERGACTGLGGKVALVRWGSWSTDSTRYRARLRGYRFGAAAFPFSCRKIGENVAFALHPNYLLVSYDVTIVGRKRPIRVTVRRELHTGVMRPLREQRVEWVTLKPSGDQIPGKPKADPWYLSTQAVHNIVTLRRLR